MDAVLFDDQIHRQPLESDQFRKPLNVFLESERAGPQVGWEAA